MVPVDTKTQDDKALDVIFRQYNKGGFVIKTIYCNGEYRAMMNKVRDDLDTEMNYTNASNHMPATTCQKWNAIAAQSKKISGQHFRDYPTKRSHVS